MPHAPGLLAQQHNRKQVQGCADALQDDMNSKGNCDVNLKCKGRAVLAGCLTGILLARELSSESL